MAGDVVNINLCSPLKLRRGLTGNYHAICHYSYNLPLYASLKKHELTKTYHHEKESTLLYFDYWIFDYFLINSSTHLK